jgi:hypothetical protein
MTAITPRPENLASLILFLRGEKVLLSDHLAKLYGVSVGALNQAVKRNIERFPDDFMFQLTRDEVQAVNASRSQNVILKRGQNVKYLPYAFTEQGIAMLSSVLRSPRAVVHALRTSRSRCHCSLGFCAWGRRYGRRGRC